MTQKADAAIAETDVSAINVIVELYKHHHDLVAKTATFYFVAVGFVAGYVLRPDITAPARLALAFFVVAASVLCIVGCRMTRRWLVGVEADMWRLLAGTALSHATLFGQGHNSLFLAEAGAWLVLAVTSILVASGRVA